MYPSSTNFFGLLANESQMQETSLFHFGSFAALLIVSTGCARQLTVEGIQNSRQALFSRAASAHIFDPDRAVVHAGHVCSLKIDKRWFPVLDIQELVKGVVTPRGVNTIIVLDPDFQLAMRLPYATERPLFCADNRLYVWGDLQVEAEATEGNELTFTDHAHRVVLRHIEANEVAVIAEGHTDYGFLPQSLHAR